MAATVIIEPLDKAKHDRAAFASGVEQVDRYLRETASRLMKGGSARVFVMIDPQRSDEILGFYSINAHRIESDQLPRRYRRFALPDGSIPAAFIGMIGVTQRAQGQGIGGRLLVDALNGAYLASQRVGTAVVLRLNADRRHAPILVLGRGRRGRRTIRLLAPKPRNA